MTQSPNEEPNERLRVIETKCDSFELPALPPERPTVQRTIEVQQDIRLGQQRRIQRRLVAYDIAAEATLDGNDCIERNKLVDQESGPNADALCDVTPVFSSS